VGILRAMPTADETAQPTASTANTEPAPPPEEPTIMGVPMTTFVRGGGTSTMANDKQIHEIEADANRRRAAQDKERQAAAIPIEDGGAKLYSHSAGTPQETAKVLLEYVTPGGEPWLVNGEPVQCLADVEVDTSSSDPSKNLMLRIVCPRCRAKDIPSGQCQLLVRQAHRKWFLDTRGQGEMLMFQGQPYYSAGLVMDSEKLTCPACQWTCRIDRNKVWPVS